MSVSAAEWNQLRSAPSLQSQSSSSTASAVSDAWSEVKPEFRCLSLVPSEESLNSGDLPSQLQNLFQVVRCRDVFQQFPALCSVCDQIEADKSIQLAPLGSGGNKAVWRVNYPRLGGEVALNRYITASKDKVEAEVSLLASCDHPNILKGSPVVWMLPDHAENRSKDQYYFLTMLMSEKNVTEYASVLEMPASNSLVFIS